MSSVVSPGASCFVLHGKERLFDAGSLMCSDVCHELPHSLEDIAPSHKCWCLIRKFPEASLRGCSSMEKGLSATGVRSFALALGEGGG